MRLYNSAVRMVAKFTPLSIKVVANYFNFQESDI